VVSKASKGLGIAALVLGIVAFVFSWIPILGLLIALSAVVLGILALVKRQPKGFSITGMSLGAFALISALVFTSSFFAFVGTSTSSIESSQSSSEEQSPEEAAPEAESVAPDLTTFGELDERTLALIAKDPAAYEATNAIVYGKITQYDSFTGRCSMRLNLGHTVMENSYEYEHNTLAFSGDGDAICPVLDPLVQDDIVKLWVTVSGAYSYETTIGGTATAILVEVWQAELMPKTEY
jgi:hypothetical protein